MAINESLLIPVIPYYLGICVFSWLYKAVKCMLIPVIPFSVCTCLAVEYCSVLLYCTAVLY